MKYWITAVASVLMLALGWQLGTNKALDPNKPGMSEAALSLPDYHWDNLNGGQSQLTDWKDKILVINHWATWCEPCRKEIPMFMAFRQQYAEQGVELIGIAHDDEDDVRRYVDSMGMDYPQLLAGLKQGRKWLAMLGSNGSLPFTLIFDRDGQLLASKLGLMHESELKKTILPLL
ncbi:MAG: TlpA disulfide reductase family protein [Arenicellales bacterium]